MTLQAVASMSLVAFFLVNADDASIRAANLNSE